MATSEAPLAAPTAPTDAEGLFIRKSSGLVREVGLREAFGINAGILCVLYAIISLFVFLVAFPNADYYLPLLIGGFISLLLCLSYSQLVATFARSGGEYVYVTRVFGPLLGAVVGGALIIGITLACAYTVIGLGQIAIPLAATAIGQALHWQALITFGSSTLLTKTAYVIVSLVVWAVFVAVCLRPIAVVARVIFWCFVLGMLAFLIFLVLLGFTSHGAFVDAFNKTSGANAYNQIISHAKATGFQPGGTLSASLLAIPVGFLFFEGFTFANYAAGELKRPARTYKIAVLAALGLGVIASLLAWAALRHTVGLHFMQASAALSGKNPAEYGKLTSVPQNQPIAYALLVSSDPVTKIILGLGTVAAFVANGLAYFMLVSRVVFALSFDRLLPTKVADVSERTHTPIYAIALIALIVLAFSVIGDATTLLSVARNFLLILTAVFALGSMAAAALPFRRKELYDASPKAIRGQVLGVPVITILGICSAIGCIVVDVVLATHTQYSGGYSTSSIITLIVVVLIGPAMYAVSRASLGRKGIDVRLAMQELPPE